MNYPFQFAVVGPFPYGFCECGCGELTTLSPSSDASKGYVKGEPRRYRRGHVVRLPVRYAVNADGCWVWQGRSTGAGYGQVLGGGRMVLVHRLYYERLAGPIPEGLQLDHLCRNRLCVNPDHLEPVTCAENVRRGRLAVAAGAVPQADRYKRERDYAVASRRRRLDPERAERDREHSRRWKRENRERNRERDRLGKRKQREASRNLSLSAQLTFD